MKKYVGVGIGLFSVLTFVVLLLVGWFDKSELEYISEVFEQKFINEYTDEPIKYALVKENKDGFDRYNHYHFQGEGNETFSELSTKQKEKVLTIMTNFLEAKYGENRLTGCGFTYTCYFDGVSLSVGNNIYSLEYDLISDDPVFYVNGSEYEDSSKLVQSKTSSSRASKREIHKYMALQFDIITNGGEYYIPEIHDPEVGRMASSRFGITESEALDIYVELELEKVN